MGVLRQTYQRVGDSVSPVQIGKRRFQAAGGNPGYTILPESKTRYILRWVIFHDQSGWNRGI
jgi:hypothetical protein